MEPSRATQVSCGGEHTLALWSDGQVRSAGVCGPAMTPAIQSILIKCSRGSHITAGSYHNLVVKECGSVLAWGCGVFSATGKNDGCIPALGQDPSKTTDKVTAPTPIPNVCAVAAAAGGYCSLLLEKSTGRVLTFGAAALGQLGRTPVGDSSDSANLLVDSTPAPVELPPDAAASTEVTSIGTGFYNTFVTCRDGRVYCSGENQYRQCGLRPTNIYAPMQRISELDGKHIVQAEGSYCHTLARTIEGHIYSLGCSEDGQRGVDADNERPLPVVTRRVVVPNGDGPIFEVAAGLNHSLAQDDAGKVCPWGSNEYGQLGLSDNNGDDDENGVAPTPEQVPGLPCRAMGISAGGSHSAILGEDGKVYTFGNPSNGQLGTGNEEGWRDHSVGRNLRTDGSGNNPNAPGAWDVSRM